MDRGAWWATVHGVAWCWTRLSNLSQVPARTDLEIVTLHEAHQTKTNIISAMCGI